MSWRRIRTCTAGRLRNDLPAMNATPHDVHHIGREMVTTLGTNAGILAFVHAFDAYTWTMRLFQLLLLLASVAYTVFRAGTAFHDWQYARQRRAIPAVDKKELE